MTSIEDILKKEKKGKLGDMWELKDPDVRFPGKAKHSKELNQALDSLYSIDTEQGYARLESMLEEQEFPASDMISISKSADISVIEQFLGFGYEKMDALKKCAQIAKVSALAETVMREATDSYREQLKTCYQERKERKDSLEACAAIRKDMDSLFDSHEAVRAEMSARGMRPDYAADERFKDYASQRRMWDSLNEEIGELMQRYLSFQDNKDPAKELKKIAGQAKSGWFKGRLMDDCVQTNYFEGQLALATMVEEVVFLADNYKKLSNIRHDLAADMGRLQTLDSCMQAMGNDLSDQDIRGLHDIQAINSGKYDSVRLAIFLDGMTEDYHPAAAALKDRAADKLSAEATRIKGSLRQIEKASSADDVSHLYGLAPQLENVIARYELLGMDPSTPKALLKSVSKRADELSQEKDSKISGYRSKVKDLSTKLDATENTYKGQVSQLREQIAQHESELEGYISRVGSLERQLGDEQGSKKAEEAAYQTEIGRYRSELETLNSRLAKAESDYADRVSSLKSQLSKASSKDLSSIESSIDKLSRGLDGRLDYCVQAVDGLKASMDELKASQVGYRPERKPDLKLVEKPAFTQDDQQNEFYELVEAMESEAVSGGWLDRLSYIKWLVDRKQTKDRYLETEQDFEIAEFVYETIQGHWKTGRLGRPSNPCTKDRLQISETLNALHSYIENSRAMYGAKVALVS
ncbi:MAG: hypothetical protein KJ709_01190 [Nanoarchaeota archaeon]|nr:hypothetical protein [Nanoarchaeota archaeon]